jgi:hypothetical protein
VTEGKRSELLPDVPTVGETVPGYEMAVWYGAFRPAGMPRPVVEKLNAEISRILFLPDVKQKMADIAVEVAKLTPEELGELTRKDAAASSKSLASRPSERGSGCLAGAEKVRLQYLFLRQALLHPLSLQASPAFKLAAVAAPRSKAQYGANRESAHFASPSESFSKALYSARSVRFSKCLFLHLNFLTFSGKFEGMSLPKILSSAAP